MTTSRAAHGSVRAGHCFDPELGGYRADVLVRWDDGIITDVEESANYEEPLGIPYVLPGLIDMHVHLEDWQEHAWRDAGVLTVRDVGCDLASLARWRGQGESGWPTIEPCGPFLETGEATWPDRAQLVDEHTAGEVLDELAAFGVRWVKAYSNISEPTLRAVIREAHHRGVRVTAHLGDVPVDRAVGYGLDGVEHALQGLYVASVGDDALPAAARTTLGPGRFWASMLGQFVDVDPDAGPMQDLIGVLGDAELVVTPTLAIVEQVVAYGAEGTAPAPFADRVPRTELDRWDTFASRLTGGWTHYDASRAVDGLDVVRALVHRLHVAGAVITAGSDAPLIRMAPGVSLTVEIQALVRVGFTVEEAVAAATGEAARALGADAGALMVGRRADLLGYVDDPLEDLDRLARPDVVVHRGVTSRGADLAGRRRRAMAGVREVPVWVPYGGAR